MNPPEDILSLPLKVQLFFATMGTPGKPGTLVDYNATTGNLVVYLWLVKPHCDNHNFKSTHEYGFRPVDHCQDRIPPALFSYYRSKHHFRNPNCFCPLQTDNLINKETLVFMPTEGPFKYQYIATCATDECPYIGKFEMLWFLFN